MNQVQIQYCKQLQRILRLKLSRQYKIEMLNSFYELLRQHYQIQSFIFNQSLNNEISMVTSQHKLTQIIQSTKFSSSITIDNTFHLNNNNNYNAYSNSNINSSKYFCHQNSNINKNTSIIITAQQIQQLQQRILKKKIQKIQHYEQIQVLEDQLYQTEDIIEYKKKLNDHLRKMIDKKMVDIQHQNQQKSTNYHIESYQTHRNKANSNYINNNNNINNNMSKSNNMSNSNSNNNNNSMLNIFTNNNNNNNNSRSRSVPDKQHNKQNNNKSFTDYFKSWWN